MIIKGNVLTIRGPKPIEKIQTGEIVLNLNSRPRKVLQVKKSSCEAAYAAFEANKVLAIGCLTEIETFYGPQIPDDGKTYKIFGFGGEVSRDTVKVINITEPVTGYTLVLEDGDGVFVDGYGIHCEKGAADA